MVEWVRGWLCLRGFHRVYLRPEKLRVCCSVCGLFIGMRTYTAVPPTPPYFSSP